MGQEKMPHTLWPARTGTSSLLHWTQFPSHPRAGLPEDNVQICSVREAPGSLDCSGSLNTQVGASQTRLHTDVWRVKHTWVLSGLWEPCCSHVLTKMIPKAKVGVGTTGLSGLGPVGSCALSTGHAYPAPETSCQRGGSPG